MAQDYIDERLEQELEAPASFTSQEVLYKDLIRSIYKYHPSDVITMVEKAYIIARAWPAEPPPIDISLIW